MVCFFLKLKTSPAAKGQIPVYLSWEREVTCFSEERFLGRIKDDKSSIYLWVKLGESAEPMEFRSLLASLDLFVVWTM